MPLGISRKAAGIAPSATLALNAKVTAMKAAGKKSSDLQAESRILIRRSRSATPPKPPLTPGKTRYTAAAGAPEFRKAIKDKLMTENGLDYDISQIVVSNGAKHSIFNAFSR